MRRQIPVTISSLVFAVMPLLPVLVGRASDGLLYSVNAGPVSNNRVVVNAAGRGTPAVNLADGVELAAEYAGSVEAQVLLRQGAAEPRALASADFDEDGVPDLICAYASPGGGILTLHRGNVDSIYPNSPAAKQREVNGVSYDSAFLSAAQVFELPDSPDFVATGDFDADGHWDVATAARGGNAVYLHSGDGKGVFAAASRIELPGLVTTFGSGDINRPDGLTDIVLAIAADDGAKALVFEGPEGALRSRPEMFDLPGEGAAIAVGRFDADYLVDFVVAAGRDLVTVHGRDRKTSLDRIRQAEVKPAEVERQSFGFDIVSIVAGNFAEADDARLALLTSDGTVYLAPATQHVASKAKTRKPAHAQKIGRSPGASGLIRARLSTGPSDDLVVVDEGGHQLHILANAVSRVSGASVPAQADALLKADGAPVAVLPMRLNADALSDLVILQSGRTMPTVIKTSPAAIFTVTNTASGPGSLFQAILDANASPGADTIVFNIPGDPPHRIFNLGGQLPAITEPVTIDGATQPGYSGTPLVFVLGGFIDQPGPGDGLAISSGSAAVRGLGIGLFSSNGIEISLSGNNVIEGNFFGTDGVESFELRNLGNGIRVLTSGNTIGGTSESARNLFVANDDNGILIVGASNPTGNVIQGNLIGTNGNTLVSSIQSEGVSVFAGTLNTIGGTTAGARNVISGNLARGISIGGLTVTGTLVQGNFIGTDPTGTSAVDNATGVQVAGPSSTIGGSAPAARNVISSNSANAPLAGGVVILTSQNIVQGNHIGTDVTGTDKLGNAGDGIFIRNGSNNLIGGSTGAAGNLIAFNGRLGVTVFADTGFVATGNAIQRNIIHSNTQLAIDLGPLGVTPNDPCDGDAGTNDLQNFPLLTSAAANGSNTFIQGALDGAPNTQFALEFFSNKGCDPSGFGEGQTFIGSTIVRTDGSCNAGFNVNLPVAVPVGQFITATATDPAGNTSEFSACIPVTAPTAVRLVSFTATRYSHGVLLEWKTGFEVDNLGFNVYGELDGKRVSINPRLILGSALLGTAGAISGTRSYSLWDKLPGNDGDPHYWLEEIDLSGRAAWHGPARLNPAQGSEASPVADGSHSSMSTIFEGENRAGTTGLSSKPIEQTASLPQGSLTQWETQRDLASRPCVKLSVKQEGWHRVTKQELVAIGFDANADSRLLQMFVDGDEIPISVVPTDDADDLSSYAVEFYGIGLGTAVTDARVYWLVEGSNPGARIEQIKGRGNKRAAASFPFTVERNDRAIYFSSLRNGERENFFGAVVAQHPVVQTLALRNLVRTTHKTALLEVALQGVTNTAHRVSLQLNGVVVGEMLFQGQSESARVLPITHTVLREGDNELTLTAEGGQTDLSLIDYVRITYQHSYAPDNDELRFTASSKQRVTLDGFSSSAIRVLDVTSPDAVEGLISKTSQSAAGYSVTLSVPRGGQRKLFAFTDQQVKPPAAIAFNNPSIWRQPDHAAELVIVSHRDLIGAVEPLRALRQSQAMAAAVVDIEDIYDEFSFGHKTPRALKDFLAFAGTNWRVAPRYVLLVGNASYDPKNHLGRGDFDLVPTKLIDTQLMETASDDWFADFDGDGLAEMSVGRFPAGTVDEAAAMISKTTEYERSGPSESVLLVSDSNDGFNFEGASAVLRGLIPANLSTEEIDRGRLDAATARQNLMEAIARGQKIVNYTGHGSATLWRGDLLTSEDGPRMANHHLPLFVMMTCLNGFFQDPELDSLAESLIKAERGGAVAVWASSGMTTPDLQATLNQQFFRLILGDGSMQVDSPTLGEATRLAKSAVNDGDVRRTWILFGDPAMRLR